MRGINCRLLVASLAVWLITVSTAAAAPISGPKYYNGHTYYLLSHDTWLGSEADAVALGGHLVAINDAAENAFIYSTFFLAGDPPELATLWIGINDAASEGTFVWSNGDPVTYTNWNSGEPNNDAPGGGQDYGLMYGAGRWDDNVNDTGPTSFGVAEIPEIVPEPATFLLVAFGLLLAARRRLQS
jgi:hypothetical protein